MVREAVQWIGCAAHSSALLFTLSCRVPSSLPPWALLPMGVKLEQKVFRLDPKEILFTARSPWNGEWELPGRSVSQKVVNG